MVWLTKLLAAALALSFSFFAVEGGTECLTDERCAADQDVLEFESCGFADADFAAIAECFNTIGRGGIRRLDLSNNQFTTVPSDFFDSMGSLITLRLQNNALATVEAGRFDNLARLRDLFLEDNKLKTLPPNIFADSESLGILNLGSNMLASLPVDAFVALSNAEVVFLDNNALTTLPEGIFEDLGGGALASLHLDGNPGLQCVPTVTASGEWSSATYFDRYIEPLPVIDGSCGCTPSSAVTCSAGTTCSPGAVGYTCDACPAGSSTCGDPHMQGLPGQTIDWSGVDGGWYGLVSDDGINLQINVRLTAPLPESFPDRQLITGLSVASKGHSLVIEVAKPYTVDTSGCPRGISPCLADGGLRAIVDGEEVDDLLRFSRHKYAAERISVSASNLPVECRQFGGDKIWTLLYEEMLQGKRNLVLEESFEDWILRFDSMAAPDWCTQYIENHDLADVQSNHAVFKIEAAGVTIRLNVGTNYQGSEELDWDGRVLPDMEFWQMDVGVHGLSLESESLSGILGETARPVLGEDGHEVMKGYEAFRGTVEDYRVSDSLGTDFALLNKH